MCIYDAMGSCVFVFTFPQIEHISAIATSAIPGTLF